MNDLGISILRGGLFTCDQEWREISAASHDYCRLWFPVSGSADIQVGSRTITIKKGQVYFVAAHQHTARLRDRGLNLQWLHIKPDSLILAVALSRVPHTHSWPANAIKQWRNVYSSIGDYFQHRTLSLELRMNAMVADIMGELLAESRAAGDSASDEQSRHIQKLLPAVSYMDQHYRRNPNLNEIARTVNQSPVHFHQCFTRAFKTTPHRYVERRRMLRACRLLSHSKLSIADVGAETGYENPFYFSRRFKAVIGMNPRMFRLKMFQTTP